MNDLQKEESWYSIKELAEGFGVHQETIKKNIRDIFGKSIDTVRKIQIKGKSRTYLYNELAKNELMKKLASNQLNQGKNHSTGKQAVKGVISNSINENDVSILLRQNQEIIRQNNEILKFLKNCIPENISNFENSKIRKNIQDYIMIYSEKEKISYEQGIKEFIDEFEYRNHINLRIRSKRNGYNSILEYAEKNNMLADLLEVARNMR